MTGQLKKKLFVLTALQGGLLEATQVLFGPKKSDFFTLHLYNPPFRSQSDLTQCDHKNCIITYSIS